MTLELWTQSFQVNTGSAATGTQTDPQILGLANGGFVVAWEEAANGAISPSPGTDIVAKIYDAEGTVTRDAFRLNFFRSVDDERDFDLTATHDGFAMAFVDDSLTVTNDTRIHFERYSLTGAPRDNFDVASFSVPGDSFSNPQLIANFTPSNDDIFIAYNAVSLGQEFVSARIDNQDGTLSAAFGVGQNAAGNYNRLGDTAVLSNGNFVTVYNEQDGTRNSLEYSIRTQTGGTVVNAAQVVSDGSNASVTALASGGFVIMYIDDRGRALMLIFNEAGALVSRGTGSNGPNDQDVAVAALADGGFVAIYQRADGTLDGITFLDNGDQLSSEFVVATNASAPKVSALADGRFAVSWIAANGEVSSAIYDQRDTVINPDDYAQTRTNFASTGTITTSVSGSEVLAATTGAKTILGQAGDDTIASNGLGSYFGGGGDDLIIAGLAANELLDGGAGNDTVDAQSVATSYFVNLATGATGVSGEIFRNFENIFTGTGNDRIVGTSGANEIRTGGGADTVLAGDGADLVNAGEGEDSITNSAGRDTIAGGAGDDTVVGAMDDETISGNDGNDSLDASGGRNNVAGGAGNDTIASTGNGSSLRGDAGDDWIVGSGLDVTVIGGDGNDSIIMTSPPTSPFVRGASISGGDGRDTIMSGDANDTITGGSDADFIDSGAGNDDVQGESGDDDIRTSAGNDTATGGLGNDTVMTGNGNDFINTFFNFGDTSRDLLMAGAGDDFIFSLGNDTIRAEAGNDFVRLRDALLSDADGGAGDDTVDFSASTRTLVFDLATGLTDVATERFVNFENAFMGEGADEVFGTTGANVILGRGGADRILALDGNDILDGGAGNDTLNGGDGNDALSGGDDNDTVYGQSGDDSIMGGAGNDLLLGNEGNDELSGGAGVNEMRGQDGNDTLLGGDDGNLGFGGNGEDLLQGGAGNDSLHGNGGFDDISGGGGQDRLFGQRGSDTLDGGAGNDQVFGGDGMDFVDGGDGNDTLFGGTGQDSLFGGAGNDFMRGNTQDDFLLGQQGDDTLFGDDGADNLNGGRGRDQLQGGNGRDTLLGGNDDDVLFGGDGNDILTGGLGVDVLRGNAGADRFVFTITSESTLGASDLIDGIDGIGTGGGDVIDLAGIDANDVSGANDAFTFLGATTTAAGLAFGAGALWVETAGAQTIVYALTDNDADIDFALRINDGAILAADYLAGDFIL
ncbi:MAG: calcium-binding protein [Pseudomonadota bacterium]